MVIVTKHTTAAFKCRVDSVSRARLPYSLLLNRSDGRNVDLSLALFCTVAENPVSLVVEDSLRILESNPSQSAVTKAVPCLPR